MIIDFHTHEYPDEIAERAVEKIAGLADLNPAGDGTLRALLQSMKGAGIDHSVILPVITNKTQFNHINDYAARLNERHPDKITSFGAIHPDCPNHKACLKTLSNMGFKGIKLHPDFQGVFINDIRYKRIIDAASELGMIISVHAGRDAGLPNPVHCPPNLAYEVLREVGPRRLILAHLGGLDQWDQVEELLVGESVYLDLAYTLNRIPTEQLLRFIRSHGSHRILFATDYPWASQRDAVEALRALPIAEGEKENIFYRNAKALLGL